MQRAQQAASEAVGFATAIADAAEANDLQQIQVPGFKQIWTRFRYSQWMQKLQMLTQYDVRGAAWPRTAELRTQALLQAEREFKAASGNLWTELCQWVQACREEFPSSRYSTLSDAEANAWVEWLEELQEKVRAARQADGTDTERIRRAVHVIVSCSSRKKDEEKRAYLIRSAPSLPKHLRSFRGRL